MDDLRRYFEHNPGNRIHKWLHYFEVYERHFARFRGSDVHLVEIGVYQGGSLQMWKEYFGPSARIYGVDMEPACRRLEEERIKIFIGSQTDRKFLASVAQQIPRIDILLDDGGHTMEQQITTFESLYPRVAPGGVYLCEDTMTSYWQAYGGGWKNRRSFIEYSKNWVDRLHAWHSEVPERFSVDDFTRTTHGVHYYDGIVVLEKRPMEEPTHRMTGRVAVQTTVPPPPQPPLITRLVRKTVNRLHALIG